MMVTAVVLQNWPGCVAVSCPVLSTLLAINFILSYVLTAASAREDFLHHILPVWQCTQDTKTLFLKSWDAVCNKIRIEYMYN